MRYTKIVMIRDTGNLVQGKKGWNEGLKKYIGIDFGGTNIALGVVTEYGKIVKKISVPTLAKRREEDVFRDLIFAVHRLLEECKLGLKDIERIGIGVPGTANKETGVLEYANNLNLDGAPFIRVLEDSFRKKVCFDNDANAAAWGEYLVGAGKGRSSLIMLTLGTGVGGGIIVNDSLVAGYNFAAGELGHMVIKLDGIPCNCGRRGCFETYCSATALIRQTQKKMENSRESLLWGLADGTLHKVSGKVLFEAVRAEDGTAIEVLANFTHYLSIGIANIINILQPEMLLIGGGISASGDLFLPALEKEVNQLVYTRNSKRLTKLAAASLYNDAGIIGAALLPL